MNTHDRIGRPSRALRPGLALALGALAAVACGEQDATTVTGAGPTPAFDVVTDRSAFDIARARTEAGLDLTPSGAEVVRLEFGAELDGLPTRATVDVVASWEQAGGIQSQPFVVSIPAGCFMSNRDGLHVEDFRACGVTAALGEELSSLIEFDARLVANGDGTARFELEALVVPPEPVFPPEPVASALLGTLGGAVVELMIGAESAGAPPLGIETVSFNPQPEPPPSG